MKLRRLGTSILTYSLLAFMLFVALFPIYWMLVTSLKPEAEIFRLVPTFWPENMTLEGYTNLLTKTDYLVWLRNSAVAALTVSVISLGLSILAAYALSRFQFPGRRVTGFGVLMAYLLPPALLFIPLYILVTRLGLSGSLASLLLVYPTITIPYATWVLTSYFNSISPDFEEAALIDGASRLSALRRIVLPLAAPGVVATFIFSFTLCWSEYLYALVMLSYSITTVPVGLSGLLIGDVPRWNQIMAGAIITSIPVIILYTVVSQYIVSGLALGGVKG